MLFSTRGIIFKCTDYSETSIVCKIYTEKFGLRTYMINGVRSSKGRIKTGLVRPLNILDLVVYERPGREIQRISELSFFHIYETLPFEVDKSMIALFLLEVLNKTILEEEPNLELYKFIEKGLLHIDKHEQSVLNFHIYFLLHLTRYLGFFPLGSFSNETPFLDLKEGVFDVKSNSHHYVVHPDLNRDISTMLKSNLENYSRVKISSKNRRSILDSILQYYSYHISNFTGVRSLNILKTIIQ